jgi:hypothetical protein
MNLKGHKGYVRRSTGETDLDRAKERSLQILGELNQRQSQNLPISRKTFAEVASGYLRDAETRWKEGRNSLGRYNVIKGTLQRYHIPFFGKRDITLLHKKDLMDYRAWRQAYWISMHRGGFDQIIRGKFQRRFPKRRLGECCFLPPSNVWMRVFVKEAKPTQRAQDGNISLTADQVIIR